MKRIVLASSYLALSLWLCGCSTVKGDFHQKLQIDAVDAQNRAVVGMQCRVGTPTDTNPITVTTPATGVRVRRSNESLSIDCRRDSLVAQATVKPRRERMEEALLPFGSVGVFVDHVSGALYAYPTALHLKVGQHVVLEHGGEAQVVQADPITATPPLVVASTQGALPATSTARGAGSSADSAKHASAAKASQHAAPAVAKSSTRATSVQPAKTAKAAPVAPSAKPSANAGSAQVPDATKSFVPRTAVASTQTAPVNW